MQKSYDSDGPWSPTKPIPAEDDPDLRTPAKRGQKKKPISAENRNTTRRNPRSKR